MRASGLLQKILPWFINFYKRCEAQITNTLSFCKVEVYWGDDYVSWKVEGSKIQVLTAINENANLFYVNVHIHVARMMDSSFALLLWCHCKPMFLVWKCFQSGKFANLVRPALCCPCSAASSCDWFAQRQICWICAVFDLHNGKLKVCSALQVHQLLLFLQTRRTSRLCRWL